MALTDDETALLRRLSNTITSNRKQYDVLNNYYNAEQAVQQLGLAVPPELAKFLTIANWPRLTVDSIEERLDVEGFRYPDADEADDELWRVWQENDLDEESQLAHTDALVYRRSYVAVGNNEADDTTPLVTVESPREVTAELDPRTRQVRDALRLYKSDSTIARASEQFATLYLPDVTVWLSRQNGSGRWVEDDRDPHELGAVTLVPMVNRARTANRFGVSEIADVIGLTDACARALTNAQVAAEALAVPQRGVLGATKGDFVDQKGQPLPLWQAYFGSLWALQNKDAKTFQFDASDLKNFETIVNLYARLVASLTGLPPHYLGFTTDNPASADAIRSSEARLVKRCERKQRAFSGTWEQVARLIRRLQTGDWEPAARRIETLWRDPSTPTIAQRADATVKLVSAGILPVEAAWEDLGYSAARRARLKAMREAEATDPLTARLLRDVAPAGPGAAGG